MKKPLNYLCFIVFAFVSLTIQAQDIKLPSPDFSTDLVSALKPGKDLGLSSGVSSAVEKENKSFASDIVGIMGGSDDDATKKLKINDRKKQRDGVLGKAFGSDTALQSYRKDVKKQIAPFKRKYKMATLIF
ncbi:chypothetical protein [Formosa agariphila KMM 3901]|uniref:Uncharacterized protein n=1 Tax=Formosa agariphila (strain DSM 15362 / KCTC 12365 / LMG 23005 / KMM 3901 / M-2Alg 35-1) TaxID=1347342 RepID=T2KJ32_FORAG|nr:hypothetical protein [Formosa agariphila]CDF77999.1 chypothetical protein [Formosa agariphila KMM 3901]